MAVWIVIHMNLYDGFANEMMKIQKVAIIFTSSQVSAENFSTFAHFENIRLQSTRPSSDLPISLYKTFLAYF